MVAKFSTSEVEASVLQLELLLHIGFLFKLFNNTVYSDVHVLVKYEFTQDGIRNQCARKHNEYISREVVHEWAAPIRACLVNNSFCHIVFGQGDLRPGTAADEGGLARRLVAFQHPTRGTARGVRLAECRHRRRSCRMGAPRSRPAVRARWWGRRGERRVPGRDGADRWREGQTSDRAVILTMCESFWSNFLLIHFAYYWYPSENMYTLHFTLYSTVHFTGFRSFQNTLVNTH